VSTGWRRLIRRRRMNWLGHVLRVGDLRNAYSILVGRPERTRQIGRLRHKWEDNIKMDLRKCVSGVFIAFSWSRMGTGDMIMTLKRRGGGEFLNWLSECYPVSYVSDPKRTVPAVSLVLAERAGERRCRLSSGWGRQMFWYFLANRCRCCYCYCLYQGSPTFFGCGHLEGNFNSKRAECKKIWTYFA